MQRPHSLLAARTVAVPVTVAVGVATVVVAALIPNAPWNVPGVPGAHGPVTYYLSPAGSDAAWGTSPQTAWRTLRRASQAVLRPGDRLLLQGGRSFAGQLRLGPTDAGNPARPVVIGSYGRGRATIATGARSGVVIVDTAGVDIRGLIIRGLGRHRGGAGINLFSDLRSGRRLRHVAISRVAVSGFVSGIAMGARHLAGFSNVRISDTVLHGNRDAGLASYGPPFRADAPGYAHAQVVVSHVTAYGNRGDPAARDRNTGSGIELASVDGARVTQSTAHDNGGSGASTTQGPIGIWAYDSTRVVIDHDLSYANRSAHGHDGGGFGLDQNTSRSVLRYDLSYGNDGAGFLLFSRLHDQAQRANAVLFDISSGDCRRTGNLGGITVGGYVSDATVAQDTVVTGAAARGGAAPPALRLSGELRAVTVRNSIFVAGRTGLRSSPAVVAVSRRGAARVPGRVRAPAAGQSLAAGVGPAPSAVLLQGNNYVAAGPWLVSWYGTRYRSLPDWRAATRQETVAGRTAGLAVSPWFRGPVLGLAVTAPGPAGGAGFRLRPGSPLLRAGLEPTHRPGGRQGQPTYSGRLSVAATPNIGAQ